MYSTIKTHKVPSDLYKDQLSSEKNMTADEAKVLESDYAERLQLAYDNAQNGAVIKPDMFRGAWNNISRSSEKEPETKVSATALKKVAEAITTYPESFTPNRKVNKAIEERANMLKGKQDLNWGAAEAAAYGTLLSEGYGIRLSGQDVRRGTFSHRHVGMYDQKTDEVIYPVANLAKERGMEVWNSSLSELAVLGFEFGHTLAEPNVLTIWEAQFGDFANGAQIVFDQFISSTEVKWQRMTGLVVQLPHGSEGQGPEHSSARLERYLQLCGDNNMVVVYPSTPAQMFHLLRRQMHRTYRKPLIVMTPKSLLRLPQAVSSVKELTQKNFQPVIGDDIPSKGVKKVALCSGKIYYDLKARQQAEKCKDVALVRIEQLFPLPLAEIKNALKPYKNAELLWVQEENRNQGAWTYLLDSLVPELGALRYVGRAKSASPAAGTAKRHLAEQEAIINEVFE